MTAPRPDTARALREALAGTPSFGEFARKLARALRFAELDAALAAQADEGLQFAVLDAYRERLERLEDVLAGGWRGLAPGIEGPDEPGYVKLQELIREVDERARARALAWTPEKEAHDGRSEG